MRQRIALWSTLVIALTATTFAIASTSAPKTISGCVDKKSGILRVSNKCLKTETTLIWNQQGIQGETGPQGPSGLNGIDGKIGEQGPQGQQGNAGKDGPAGAIGPQGPGGTGPQGPAGVSNRLIVQDANNSLVGYPLAIGQGSETSTAIGLREPYTTVTLWMPSISNLMTFNLSGTPVLWSFLFTTPDCSGTAYGYETDWSDSVGKRAVRFSLGGAISWYGAASRLPSTGRLSILSRGGEGACTPFVASIDLSAVTYDSWQIVPNPLAGISITGPLKFVVG